MSTSAHRPARPASGLASRHRRLLPALVTLGLSLVFAVVSPDVQAQSRYVGPNCEAEPAAGVLDTAPFNLPAVRDLWRARQALLAWEATPEVAALLDELVRKRAAAEVYYASLGMVYLYVRDPKLQAHDRNTRTFILSRVTQFQENRTAPEAWLETVNKLLQADREQRVRQFIEANRSAAAAMDKAALRLPGRQPVLDELTVLAAKAHSIWTVACSTPIRMLHVSTLPPQPTGFLFDTTGSSREKPVFDNEASQTLVRMHHDQSTALVDGLAVMNGEPLVVRTLVWGGLWAFIKQMIETTEPALLADIGKMSGAQLDDLRAKLREGAVANQPTYATLGSRPAINKAILDRRVALRGLATELSPLPWKEKARLNLPPTENELLSLLTDQTMAYTASLNRQMEFVRVSPDTFEDYSNSSLLGRYKSGESQVNMLEPECKRVAKGHLCSFISNIYRTQSGLLGSRARALQPDEKRVVVSWGPNGLVSEDLWRQISGWVRTQGGSGGGGGGRTGDDGRETTQLHQAGEERANEREERQRRAQERWEADQEERRRRNRSCGPAPNICN